MEKTVEEGVKLPVGQRDVYMTEVEERDVVIVNVMVARNLPQKVVF